MCLKFSNGQAANPIAKRSESSGRKRIDRTSFDKSHMNFSELQGPIAQADSHHECERTGYINDEE